MGRDEVGLGGLKRGVWEIRGSSLRRLEVAVDARKPVVEAVDTGEPTKAHLKSIFVKCDARM